MSGKFPKKNPAGWRWIIKKDRTLLRCGLRLFIVGKSGCEVDNVADTALCTITDLVDDTIVHYDGCSLSIIQGVGFFDSKLNQRIGELIQSREAHVRNFGVYG